jgi:hypothetical protein
MRGFHELLREKPTFLFILQLDMMPKINVAFYHSILLGVTEADVSVVLFHPHLK